MLHRPSLGALLLCFENKSSLTSINGSKVLSRGKLSICYYSLVFRISIFSWKSCTRYGNSVCTWQWFVWCYFISELGLESNSAIFHYVPPVKSVEAKGEDRDQDAGKVVDDHLAAAFCVLKYNRRPLAVDKDPLGVAQPSLWLGSLWNSTNSKLDQLLSITNDRRG